MLNYVLGATCTSMFESVKTIGFTLRMQFACVAAVEQLNQAPNSLNLAPSEQYMYHYRNSKSHLLGTRFRDDDELNDATEAWIWDKTDHFYFKDITAYKKIVPNTLRHRGIILKNNVETIIKPPCTTDL